MTRRAWQVGLVLVVVIAAIGLVSPRVVRSPAQLAADRAAPELPPATAVVERRVLTAIVTFRGVVTNERRTDVSAVAAPGGRAVVTSVRVHADRSVGPGRVLVEVSGRPVILLEGRLPAYRDLRTGATGPDVRQLQTALRGLGYPVSDRAGTFGAATTAAVRRLYVDRGYDPPSEPKAQTRLPVAEVVFLAGLPARVDRLDAKLGGAATGTLMTLSSGRSVVQGSLAPGDRALVRVGQDAQILSEVLDERTTGRVLAIGRLTADQGPPGYPVRIALTSPDPRLFDRDVRVTIAAARTKGRVLVVPLSGVTARADGSAVVDVLAAGTSGPRTVEVTLGFDTGGYVAVTPVRGELRAGDRIIVGVSPS